MGAHLPKAIEDGPISKGCGRLHWPHGHRPMPGGSAPFLAGLSRVDARRAILPSRWASAVEGDAGASNSSGSGIEWGPGDVVLGPQFSDRSSFNGGGAGFGRLDDTNAGEVEE